jgi:hypothetical protein
MDVAILRKGRHEMVGEIDGWRRESNWRWVEVVDGGEVVEGVGQLRIK